MKPDIKELLFWKYAMNFDDWRISHIFKITPEIVCARLATEGNVHENLIQKFKGWGKMPEKKPIISTRKFPEFFGDGKSSFPERIDSILNHNKFI